MPDSTCKNCKALIHNHKKKPNQFCEKEECQFAKRNHNYKLQERTRCFHGMTPWNEPRACRYCNEIFSPKTPKQCNMKWCYKEECQQSKKEYFLKYIREYHRKLRSRGI